jgi:hypothetical protein
MCSLISSQTSDEILRNPRGDVSGRRSRRRINWNFLTTISNESHDGALE